MKIIIVPKSTPAILNIIFSIPSNSPVKSKLKSKLGFFIFLSFFSLLSDLSFNFFAPPT